MLSSQASDPLINQSPHLGVHYEGEFIQFQPKSILHDVHPSESTLLLSSQVSDPVIIPFGQTDEQIEGYELH